MRLVKLRGIHRNTKSREIIRTAFSGKRCLVCRRCSSETAKEQDPEANLSVINKPFYISQVELLEVGGPPILETANLWVLDATCPAMIELLEQNVTYVTRKDLLTKNGEEYTHEAGRLSKMLWQVLQDPRLGDFVGINEELAFLIR